MAREFDLIIFGASGFTGQYVAIEVAKCAAKENKKKWAVAGRSQVKLEKVLKMIQNDLGKRDTSLLLCLR